MLNVRVHPHVALRLEVNPRIEPFSYTAALLFRVMYSWDVRIAEEDATIKVIDLKKGWSIAEVKEGASARDFKRLRSFCKLAASFMEYRGGKVDFAAVQRTAVDAAGNRPIPTLNIIPRDDVSGMIAYMLGWLLGRKIEARLARDEQVVALVGRLAAELDD